VRIEQALPASTNPPYDRCITVRTSASLRFLAFKEQISDQLEGAILLAPGPVRMQLAFTIGPGRNWLNLWKPVIDALGKILGRAPTAARWSTLDDRIVDLGLHCQVDPRMSNDAVIAIGAEHVRE
jgi:hypothetical protein